MSSITVRFLVLLLVAALPVFAVQVSNQIEQRDQQRAHTIAQANRFAHAVAQEQERLIEGMRYLLTALAQLPSVRNHEASCSARLTGIADPLLSIGRLGDRTSVVSGTRVSVRVVLGGRRIIKKTNHPTKTAIDNTTRQY